MELRHLRYFRVVAEELHSGRAAARFIAPASRSEVVFVCLPDDVPETEFGAIWRRDEADPLRARFLESVAALARADNALTA